MNEKTLKMILNINIIIITILIAIIPMSFSPFWNGKIPQHRNQYEVMARNIKSGRVSFDYEVDPKLLKMDNPYSPEERAKLGVNYHWDHAFYNGKYYMYFGIGPVITTFLPYLLVTGNDLTTYHATQLYVAIFITGVFVLFKFLRNQFFKKQSDATYYLFAIAFSLLSIWISIGTPALYCTAITAALASVIWSMYFYFKAVYDDGSLNKKIIYATIGSLFGAYTFACRPPIGIVLLLAIPLFITFLKNNKITKKDILKIIIIFIPYIIIGALLMYYNYIRFNNPFEFGQAYQLTLADQQKYSLTNIDIKKIINYVKDIYFEPIKFKNTFPYINIAGIFINFPILILGYILMYNIRLIDWLKEKKLFSVAIVLMLLPFIVTIFDAIYAPYVIYRYRLDIYFILAIFTYFIISIYLELYHKKWFNYVLWGLLVITIIATILLVFVPTDGNFTAYYRDIIIKINDFITFWR